MWTLIGLLLLVIVYYVRKHTYEVEWNHHYGLRSERVVATTPRRFPLWAGIMALVIAITPFANIIGFIAWLIMYLMEKGDDEIEFIPEHHGKGILDQVYYFLLKIWNVLNKDI